MRRAPGPIIALAMIAIPSAASADVVDPTPLLQAICPKEADGTTIDAAKPMDKEAIAGALLDSASVPRRFESMVKVYRDENRKLTPREMLIAANQTLCKEWIGNAGGKGQMTCGADAATLGVAAGELHWLFSQPNDFVVTGSSQTASLFFTDDHTKVFCVKSQKTAGPSGVPSQPGGSGPEGGGANTGASAPLLAWTNFRVRGAASDLVYDRAASAFSNAGKGTVSYGSDTGKKALTLDFAVGYAVPLADRWTDDEHHRFGDIVPYISPNVSWSRKPAQSKSFTSDTIDFGAVIELEQVVSHLTPIAGDAERVEHSEDYFAIIPHVTTNYQDHSQVAGVNILFRPSYTFGLNNLRPFGDSGLWWDLIGDVRFNNGVFTRKGARTMDASRDFSRIGARVGAGLESDIKNFPATLNITDTFMEALTGRPRTLSEFSTDFALYLSEKKYFGLDINYSRGRFEDLSARDDKWTVGLAVKY
jgi:hypothetical protein